MAKGLGKGLSALMGENLLNGDGELNHIAIENIEPNPKQPRVMFSAIELEELASSIKQNGILQPILLSPLSDGKYQIIAGERRWRAAKAGGLSSIPAIIKKISEREVVELALIENIQRENLTSIEEAEGYKRLIDEYQYTQENQEVILLIYCVY